MTNTSNLKFIKFSELSDENKRIAKKIYKNLRVEPMYETWSDGKDLYVKKIETT